MKICCESDMCKQKNDRAWHNGDSGTGSWEKHNFHA